MFYLLKEQDMTRLKKFIDYVVPKDLLSIHIHTHNFFVEEISWLCLFYHAIHFCIVLG